jgi:hypothetical protein
LKKPSGIYAARAFSSRCRPIAGSPKRRFAKDALLDGRRLYRIAHPGFATSSPPRGAPAVSQACPALVRRCGFLPTGVPDNVALLTHGEASVPSAVARSNLGLFSGCPNKTLHCLAHSSLRLASLNDSHDPIIQRPDKNDRAVRLVYEEPVALELWETIGALARRRIKRCSFRCPRRFHGWPMNRNSSLRRSLCQQTISRSWLHG